MTRSPAAGAMTRYSVARATTAPSVRPEGTASRAMRATTRSLPALGIDTLGRLSASTCSATRAERRRQRCRILGGPVEFITDLNWAEDWFHTTTRVNFAINIGAGTGADLNASANNAIAAAFALSGTPPRRSRRIHFGGRTSLAIDQVTPAHRRYPSTCSSTSPARPVRSAIANSSKGAIECPRRAKRPPGQPGGFFLPVLAPSGSKPCQPPGRTAPAASAMSLAAILDAASPVRRASRPQMLPFAGATAKPPSASNASGPMRASQGSSPRSPSTSKNQAGPGRAARAGRIGRRADPGPAKPERARREGRADRRGGGLSATNDDKP